MKKRCNFCGVITVNPCKDRAELSGHVEKGYPLGRCREAFNMLDVVPTEDAFAIPQNGHLSDTAKAQIAMEGLKPSAAPSPYEWGLMRENAARGIPAPTPFMEALQSGSVTPPDWCAVEAREAAIERRRQQIVDAGHIVEWTGDYPSARVSKTEGVKFDDGKLRFDLIPPDALAVVAAVLTYGALKYDDRNWELGMDRARLRAARDRHENARLLGQQEDPETNLPHLAHEAACTLMELALVLRGKGSDTAAEIPEASRAAVEKYGTAAVRNGRIAASRKAAQHG